MNGGAFIRDVKSNFGAGFETVNVQSVAEQQLDPMVHVQQSNFYCPAFR
jgi:hypothetical protein